MEAKTPFARWYEPGSQPLPDDEASADMYRTASALLQQAGFEHYEISNYAKPGYRCSNGQLLSELVLTGVFMLSGLMVTLFLQKCSITAPLLASPGNASWKNCLLH